MATVLLFMTQLVGIVALVVVLMLLVIAIAACVDFAFSKDPDEKEDE